MNINHYRYRSDGLQVRPALKGNGRVLSGYSAVFGETAVIRSTPEAVDREVIERGAFSLTLEDGHDIEARLNHDPKKAFARTSDGTLRIRQDDHGLFIECQVREMGPGLEVIAAMDRGAIGGQSICYTPRSGGEWIRSRQEGSRMVRESVISSADLFDVGPVYTPAYKGTSVRLRGDAAMTKRDARARMERIRAESRALPGGTG